MNNPKTDGIEIPRRGKGDKIAAFVAEPSGPPRGNLVMLQEVFGVNEAMREKARECASAGFLVVVPDLFWRLQRRIDLGYSESERKPGFGLMQRFDQAAGAADVGDVISWLAKAKWSRDGCRGILPRWPHRRASVRQRPRCRACGIRGRSPSKIFRIARESGERSVTRRIRNWRITLR